MIEAINLTKRFDDIKAVDHINAVIREGSVFGLIGTNGAGKSTFLRMAAGILKPDEGRVTIDGEDIFENDKVKSKFFYISDEQYFLNNATPGEMMKFYRNVYRNFDEKRFFGLPFARLFLRFPGSPIRTASVSSGKNQPQGQGRRCHGL